MITTLEERKIKLLSQIENLKTEVDILKWIEYKELALRRCTCSVRNPGPNRPHKSSRN